MRGERCVVAVTGLAFEARIARGPAVAVVSGAAGEALVQRVAREIARGAVGIVSVGLAGGLTNGIGPGACVVGRAVVAEDARSEADPAWVAALARKIPHARLGDVAGVDAVVADPTAKRALHAKSLAAVVDTESHVVARIARTYALPFAVLRVVCDPVDRGLPPVSRTAVADSGTIRTRDVLRSLASTPRQVPAVARTAIDAALALGALSRARRRLGPGLGCPYLSELELDVA